MTWVWRATNVVLAVSFGFGALVQLNDPDPLRWILVYLAAAATSLLAVVGTRAWLLAAPTAAVALLWAIAVYVTMPAVAPLSSLFDEFEMKSVVIEETREVLGLALIALWMCAVMVVEQRSRPTP